MPGSSTLRSVIKSDRANLMPIADRRSARAASAWLAVSTHHSVTPGRSSMGNQMRR
jgi:hypothetical protein